MSNSYNKILTHGVKSTLNNLAIEEGKLRFVTDSGELFLDMDGERIEFSDVIKGYTETEIMNILAPLPKMYLSSDTNKLYIHDGSSWQMVGSDVTKLSGYPIGGTGANGAVWGYIPLVKTDGGIELGKYIDFHLTSNDGIDRFSRIMVSTGDDQPIFTFSGSSSTEGAIVKANQVHADQYHGTYYGTLGYPAKITLNGVEFSYAATSASATSFASGLVFYAPTTAGTSNQILIADSSGKPSWADSAPLATAFKSGDMTITFAQFYSAFSSALTTLQTAINNKLDTSTYTTHSTTVGTTTALGHTKLYTALGTATDGTMTQNAIATALGSINSLCQNENGFNFGDLDDDTEEFTCDLCQNETGFDFGDLDES